MGRPPLHIDVTSKDQKELAKLLSGGVQQVRVVLRALALLQLAEGTSAPQIYAAGDIANAWHPFHETWIRLEHWSSALNQGPVAAKNMLGISTPYDKVPYFFSDQYDLGMEYRGWAPGYEQVVFRGDPASGEFIAFWLGDGVVRAAMNANVWDQGDALEALLLARATPDPAALADPDTDLAALVDAGRPA